MLKRALFAGAALVIGAMSLQGAVTPASAGPYVKPKVSLPKPQIRFVRPDLGIRTPPPPPPGGAAPRGAGDRRPARNSATAPPQR